MHTPKLLPRLLPLVAGCGLAAWAFGGSGTAQKPASDAKSDYAVKPIVQKYCLGCHSTKAKKGSLDLERFATLDDIRKDVKLWQGIIEQIEAGEMPPKDKPQPTAAEKKQLVAWVRSVPRRRGEGPRRRPGPRPAAAAEQRRVRLHDSRPDRRRSSADPRVPRRRRRRRGLHQRRRGAHRHLAGALHQVPQRRRRTSPTTPSCCPDGFRFSPSKTRRDWTDEGTAALRKFYAAQRPPTANCRCSRTCSPRFATATRSPAGKFAEVAAKEKLNAKYLRVLWETLTDKTPSHPLDAIRAKWRTATEKDVPALAAEVAAWQTALWRTVRVGSYVQAKWGEAPGRRTIDSYTRQVPVDPAVAQSVPLRLAVKPTPGQSEVTLYLAAREAGAAPRVTSSGTRPRFEATGKPALLLSDYAKFGPAFEVDYPTAFVDEREVPRRGRRACERQEAHARRPPRRSTASTRHS